jgi:hypothetical protein
MGAETRLVSDRVAKVSAASRPFDALIQNRLPAITSTGVFVVKNWAARISVGYLLRRVA